MTEKSVDVHSGILGYEISALGITEIILRDFDHSWEYYKFNLEERRDIISRIYNFVGFPIFGVGIVVFLFEKSIISYKDIIPTDVASHSVLAAAIIGLVLSFYGLLQLIALAAESRVSRDYLGFLNNVRRYIGENSHELRPFLKYNGYEKSISALFDENDLSDFRKKKYGYDVDQAVSDFLQNCNKPIEPWFVQLVVKMKGTYWRAASAIFIVAGSISLTITLGFYLLSGSLEWISAKSAGFLVTLGVVLTFGMFVKLSWLFRAIAGVRERPKRSDPSFDRPKVPAVVS